MKSTEFFYELAREIKPQGYRCFLYDHDFSNWMSVITPKGSWIEVFHGDFGGYNLTYQYVPSREFGSGCRYNDDTLWEITSETIDKAEEYGKSFSSRNMGKRKDIKYPKHYENGYEALMESYFGSRGYYEEI